MSKIDIAQRLNKTVKALSEQESLNGLFHQHRDGDPLPSGKVLEDIIDISRSILLPGYFGRNSFTRQTLEFHIGVRTEKLQKLLAEQVLAGLCFSNHDEEESADELECEHCKAEDIAMQVIEQFPNIRRILSTDITAAYNGDPAAESREEIVSCYPVIKALTSYRIAHELFKRNVPLIPRLITEIAHSETGIDIHPGAQIGEYFTIDHGTGVVIGATCIIGRNVKLYQGVTLGAKSFPLDENGNPIKGIPRHPIIKDNVVIYSNATILGRITIGEGCVVGANVWVTKDMKPNTKKYKKDKIDNLDLEFNNGTGI
ncbi:serine O-acetyltransferase EpsC [Prevotella sp. AGR2160]|uniref:serine O-acetyltransferase EpsC n=1 Tax=Prevotella sp. AGR2160 TaxID=1280674 RepID=UPI0004902014|nr:serine O-acetyltransferase EpsC [Prevotella sp. AGR2160]